MNRRTRRRNERKAVVNRPAVCEPMEPRQLLSGENQAPVARDDVYVMTEGAVLTVNAAAGLLANDGDADGHTLALTHDYSGMFGDLVMHPDGSFTFTPDAERSGAVTFSYEVDDGHFGLATAQVTIEITPTPDGAVEALPVRTVTAPEDTMILLTESDEIRFTAAPDHTVAVMLATDGSLTLASRAGLTFTVGDGISDGHMSFSGSVSAVNAAFQELLYVPAANFHGLDGITIEARDVELESFTFERINVRLTSVLDLMTFTFPAGQNTVVGQPLLLSAENGNAIGVADVESEAGAYTATLSVGSGYLTVYPSPSVEFTDGDGVKDRTMTFTAATLSQLQSVLSSVLYTPSMNGPVTESVTLSVVQGMRTTVGSFSIEVTHAGTGPVLLAAEGVTVEEDSSFTFTGEGGERPLVVFDPDAHLVPVMVRFTATNGTLTLGSLVGVELLEGTGAGDMVLQISGGRTALNSALSCLTFTPDADFSGEASVFVEVSDDSGGLMRTIPITVTAVNDAPTVTVPESLSVNDGEMLYFTGPGAITVADVDAGGTNMVVSLSVAGGTLWLDDASALDDFYSNEDHTILSLGGSLEAINAALASLRFVPDSDYDPLRGITVFVDDQGNGGAGETGTALVERPIELVDVNDAPAAEDADFDLSEDSTFTLGAPGLSSMTSDADGDPLTFALVSGPAHGTLTLLANGAFTYKPAKNYFGTDQFTYRVSDGNGGMDTAVVTLDVAPVNDVPVVRPAAAVRRPGQNAKLYVLKGATDADGDTLSIKLLTQPKFGKATVVTNGTSSTADDYVLYTPNAGAVKLDTVNYEVRDGRGGAVSLGTFVIVEGAGLVTNAADPKVRDLVVVYPSGKNKIVLSRKSGGVAVARNGVSLGVFNPTGRVIVWGGEGDDRIEAAKDLGRAVEFHGGAGNDTLIGTSLADKLFGDAGNDVLQGNGGRDSLQGGGGTNQVLK